MSRQTRLGRCLSSIRMLILFDIDGTLLRTDGAGIRAMAEAGRELFGDTFTLDGINPSGWLDPLIFMEGARQHGLTVADGEHARFRSRYREILHEGMTVSRRFQSRAMPGIVELMGGLRADPDGGRTLGLLTGNYAETGQVKIEAAGIDFTTFEVHAWGDDGGHRRELVPVAMARYAELRSQAIEAERVLIIGDTVRDVDCAKHHGCRILAVCTGGSTPEELEAAGADHIVDNLADTRYILDWISTGCDATVR